VSSTENDPDSITPDQPLEHAGLSPRNTDNNFKAWCSQHQAHPNDCFSLHNPITEKAHARYMERQDYYLEYARRYREQYGEQAKEYRRRLAARKKTAADAYDPQVALHHLSVLMERLPEGVSPAAKAHKERQSNLQRCPDCGNMVVNVITHKTRRCKGGSDSSEAQHGDGTPPESD
jgi:hypothetical protein